MHKTLDDSAHPLALQRKLEHAHGAHQAMLRLLHEADLPAAVELIRTSFADVARDFGLTRDNCPGNGAFLAEEKLVHDYRRGVVMFGLFLKTKQIGYIAVKPRDVGTYYLEKLAVLPEQRRTGWGAALVGHASDHILGLGGSRIRIGVIADNQRLRRWYAGLGFAEVGVVAFKSLPFRVCYLEADISLPRNVSGHCNFEILCI